MQKAKKIPVVVNLLPEQFSELQEIASREHRTLGQQAAYLIQKQLKADQQFLAELARRQA